MVERNNILKLQESSPRLPLWSSYFPLSLFLKFKAFRLPSIYGETALCNCLHQVLALREDTFPEPEEVPTCTPLQHSLWWLPGAQVDSQDRLKQGQQGVQRQSLSRCGGAAKVTPRGRAVPREGALQGSLGQAVSVLGICTGFSQNILDGSHMGSFLSDTESWLG